MQLWVTSLYSCLSENEMTCVFRRLRYLSFQDTGLQNALRFKKKAEKPETFPQIYTFFWLELK